MYSSEFIIFNNTIYYLQSIQSFSETLSVNLFIPQTHLLQQTHSTSSSPELNDFAKYVVHNKVPKS